jgi:hypothetical protein
MEYIAVKKNKVVRFLWRRALWVNYQIVIVEQKAKKSLRFD